MRPVEALRYLGAAWAASLRTAMEYRLSFLAQAGFMLLNNLIFLAFWGVFFARFGQVRGWGMRDVALLYAVAASGFGMAAVLMGGCLRLSLRIAQGDLDTWLLRPRPVFLQAGSAQMHLAGWGDLASGLILLAASGNATPTRVPLYLLMVLVGATVMTAFMTLCNSLAFFVGGADDLAWQSYYAMITFALYPPSLFSGPIRVVLYVLLPAGLMSYLPTELLRQWSWRGAGLLALGVALLVTVTSLVWRAGLRRYESGNLTQHGMV